MWGNFLVPIPGEVPRARCSRPLDAVRGNSLGSRAGDPPRARLAGLPTICAGKLLGLRSREASPRVWRRVGITRGADPWCPRPEKLPARAVASAQRLSGETHWPGAPRNRPSESTWMRGTCPLGCGSAWDDRPGSASDDPYGVHPRSAVPSGDRVMRHHPQAGPPSPDPTPMRAWETLRGAS